MTTLVMPPSPVPTPTSPGDGARVVTVFANLLPDEVVAARRARVVKHYVLVGLAAVLVLLVGVYGLSWWQTRSAHDDLSSAQNRAVGLEQKQRAFQPLVTAQAQSTQIQQSVQKLMAGDLQWTGMLATLRTSAGPAITLTSVTGNVTVGDATAATAPGAPTGYSVLNTSGKEQVGTLTISGTARDKNSVAAYVDTLSRVKGLAAAFPASITSGGSGNELTFSVSVLITSDALGGRFTPKTPTTGGK